MSDDPQSESLYNEGVSVPVGFQTKIILNNLVIKKQPKPYNQCVNDLSKNSSYDSHFYRNSFDPERNYHYSDCRNLCLQKLFASECQCQHSLFRFVYDSQLRGCFLDLKRSNNDLICIYNSFLKFSKNIDYINECDCPIECEKSYFEYKNSISDYPTRQMSKYLSNYTLIKNKFGNRTQSSISFDEIRESVARVTIFYDEMKQTVLSEEIKTNIGGLVSNIGGILGLFLGKELNYNFIFGYNVILLTFDYYLIFDL